MRFKLPTSGDIRIKTKFAILPVIIGNEIRWLEVVKIKQCYSERECIWQNDCFID